MIYCLIIINVLFVALPFINDNLLVQHRKSQRLTTEIKENNRTLPKQLP